MEANGYRLYENATLWDLPGYGTKRNEQGIRGEEYVRTRHIMWYFF